MKLNIKAFALTCGILWGLSLFTLTWIIILFEDITLDFTVFTKFYIGYSISPVGSIFGLIWGFVDGTIGGIIFSWLYNWLINKLDKQGRL